VSCGLNAAHEYECQVNVCSIGTIPSQLKDGSSLQSSIVTVVNVDILPDPRLTPATDFLCRNYFTEWRKATG
jgi:hypothetical protein